MMVAETSIITGITLSGVIGVLLDTGFGYTRKEKAVLAAVAVALFCCLVLMGNRSGLLGFFVFMGFVWVVHFKNLKLYLYLGLVGLLVPAVLMVSSGKFKNRVDHLFSTRIALDTETVFTENDYKRFTYWELSWAQFAYGGKKLFGMGPRNYPSISVEALHKESSEVPLVTYDKPHAHNMYLTKLCEEGAVGLTVMLLLMGLVLLNLLRCKKQGSYFDWRFTACLGALIIPATAGFFYAPYRREVAWVSILFISLFMNSQEKGRHHLPGNAGSGKKEPGITGSF